MGRILRRTSSLQELFVKVAALLSCLACLVAAPARADDYVSFVSPSGNIGCAIYIGDGYAEARCDMRELTPSYRKPPPGCDLDWGNSFAVGSSGGGYLACVGDSVFDPGAFTLGYGKSFSLGPFTCSSEKTGMTCVNPQGHGFKIAKARQQLF
jgi:hypothetical protein